MKNKGFTLLEVLLYVALLTLLVVTVTQLYFLFLQSRIKNQAIAEVEQQGIQAMQRITFAVRNSTGISSPSAGITSASLTLIMPTGTQNPTLFSSSSGSIRMTEGTGSAILLTNSKVIPVALTFSNVSRTGTPGIVKIQFMLKSVNPSGRNEYDYSKTFYGSADVKY